MKAYGKTAYYMHAKHVRITHIRQSPFFHINSLPRVICLAWRTIYTHLHETGLKIIYKMQLAICSDIQIIYNSDSGRLCRLLIDYSKMQLTSAC